MPFSDTCWQISAATNASQSITIPGTSIMQYQAYFEYANNSNVFICLNTAPTVPVSGSSSTQAYSEFKPVKRYVKGGDVLYFITPDVAGAYVGVSLRKLQG
jgi:hypothetical protein